ncbi:MAG: NUDIX hydrolase [Gammaproteobacteria bacterium]|nr:NUDIX hydrolase [Gammaproteobacteria bacterium]
MNDYDPEQVQIRPAATVMLIDDRPDLQVFMMERHANTIFAGGMWVFPGGSVDATDDSAEFQAISIHRSDAEASRLMGLQVGGLAYYIAAIREAFEEAGILLALQKDTLQPLDLSNPDVEKRFQQHRDDINDSNRNFIEIIKDENLIMDAGEMHYIARWITPAGPPRRFDARFFIARIPTNQTPIHDDGELVHSKWISPKEILRRVEAEEMVLMSPTLRMVKNLALFDSARQVIESAAANQIDELARVLPGTRVVVMPGEEGYDTGLTDIESGWVRLRPLRIPSS